MAGGSEDGRILRCLRIFCYTPIHSCNRMVEDSLSVLISITLTMKYNNSQVFALWLYQLLSEEAGQYTTTLCNGYVLWFKNNINSIRMRHC